MQKLIPTPQFWKFQNLWCHEVNNIFKVKKTDITPEEKFEEPLAIEARTNSMKF